MQASLKLSETEHQVLSTAVKQIEAGQLTKARQALKQFNLGSPSPYALSLSWQMLANLAFNERHWVSARAHYRQSLLFSGRVKKDRRMIHSRLMQANYQLKDWQGSVDHWLMSGKVSIQGKAPSLTAEDYLRASLSYKALDKCMEAKQTLNKALEFTKVAKLSWFQHLLAVERCLNNDAEQIKVLKQLLEMAPAQQSYWLALANLYKDKGNNTDAIALLYTAFKNGVLESSVAIKWLASGLSQQGSPAAASKVIESALERSHIQSDEAGVLLLSFYTQAKMFSKAVKLLQQSKATSTTHAKLAQLYFQNKQWQLAYRSARSIPAASSEYSLKIELLMAVSAMHLRQLKLAARHFNAVLTLEPNHVSAKDALQKI